MRRVRLTLSLIVIGSSLTPCMSRAQDEPIRLKTDLVTINAAVSDSRGNAIKSLRQPDFRIFEDGVEQKIAHFAATEEPFSVMLLLDVSGSTSGEIEMMKKAATAFVDELRNADRVGVMVFSRDIHEVGDLNGPRSQTESAIQLIATPVGDLGSRFNANTGTSFYDALYEAAENGSLKRVEGRKAIVCMSDGVDSTSKKVFAQVAPVVEKSDASVYFLELNTEEATLDGLLKPPTDPGYINLSQTQLDRYFEQRDPDSPMRGLDRRQISALILRDINAGLYDIARRDLRALSERTGGRVYPVKSLEELRSVYRQIADELRSVYSISYYPSNLARDGRWREIKVEVKRGGAIVRARSGYWAGTH